MQTHSHVQRFRRSMKTLRPAKAGDPARAPHKARYIEASRQARQLTAIFLHRESAMPQDAIIVERVDHIGIRVRDLERALAFYRMLGFELLHKVTFDAVAIIKNKAGVEINLIYNGNAGDAATNILMDVGEKYPGYTHVALRVGSIGATVAALKANDIAISEGPVKFGDDGGVSVFIRDPDRNVIELRGRDQGPIEGVKQYVP
jgi:lactoylglutathione lyase